MNFYNKPKGTKINAGSSGRENKKRRWRSVSYTHLPKSCERDKISNSKLDSVFRLVSKVTCAKFNGNRCNGVDLYSVHILSLIHIF